MGCYACNPYCGKCKPAKEKPLKCPACGTYNFPELRPDRTCKKCGSVLPDRVLLPHDRCSYTGELCAAPCKQFRAAPEGGKFMPCVAKKIVL